MFDPFASLSGDSEVRRLMLEELKRQEEMLVLIASAKASSHAVMAAESGPLGNVYGEGLPGARYYTGCEIVDQIEELARFRACQVFGAGHPDIMANVQPWCGSTANAIAYAATMQLGDHFMGPGLDHFGHLTHGTAISASGTLYVPHQYGVDGNGVIDLNQVRELAQVHHPKVIVVGFSAYSRIPDYKAFAAIGREVDAILMADVARVAGLIAAGVHQNPLALGFDLITMTTHKTLPGPRGGLIVARRDFPVKGKKKLGSQINRATFPYMQGGPDFGKIAAKAVALGEAAKPQFRARMQRVVEIARGLASGLVEGGFDVVSGGTDNHLFVVDFRRSHPNFSGKQIAEALVAANISTSASKVPGDQRSAVETSGIRIGSQVMEARGANSADSAIVADWIARVVNSGLNSGVITAVRGEVMDWCKAHPAYPAWHSLWNPNAGGSDYEEIDDYTTNAHGEGVGDHSYGRTAGNYDPDGDMD